MAARPALLWLDGTVDDPRVAPVLREERYVDDSRIEDDLAAPPLQQVEHVTDHPHVRVAFDAFLRLWSAWAKQDLRGTLPSRRTAG